MRRTELGQFGPPPRDALETVSRALAADLGWSEERRQSEIAGLSRLYQTRGDA